MIELATIGFAGLGVSYASYRLGKRWSPGCNGHNMGDATPTSSSNGNTRRAEIQGRRARTQKLVVERKYRETCQNSGCDKVNVVWAPEFVLDWNDIQKLAEDADVMDSFDLDKEFDRRVRKKVRQVTDNQQ